ncbi:hypothetical protein HMPREF9124_0053 [Oribacterium sp. oral taxon 108 str. F0425]|nr:hypothetical protein HMPREF9124_0053 [Oribacterium sp. oral taxon 108 str. F0425]
MGIRYGLKLEIILSWNSLAVFLHNLEKAYGNHLKRRIYEMSQL